MKPLLIVILLTLSLGASAQEDGYATVAAINNNILVLDNCMDEDGVFKINQKVVIIQRENNSSAIAVKNSKANNTNADNQVPRKYVVLTITEVERTDNIVTSIKVSRDLQNSFYISSSAAVDVRILSSRKWHW